MLITIWSVSIEGSLSCQCLRTRDFRGGVGEGSVLCIALGLTQRKRLKPITDQEAKTCATGRVLHVQMLKTKAFQNTKYYRFKHCLTI